MVESSKKLPAWRAAVKKEASKHKTEIDRPVEVRADFFMPKPRKPRFDKPAVAPDLDKLQRAIGDALEQAGVIKNDSRIVRWVSEKHYSDKPGATITITEV